MHIRDPSERVFFFCLDSKLVLLLALGTHAWDTVSSLTGRLQGTKYIKAYTAWVNNIVLASKEYFSQAYKKKIQTFNTKLAREKEAF